jgi:hypothetical protein
VINFLTQAVAAEHAADLRREAAAHFSTRPYEVNTNPRPSRPRPARIRPTTRPTATASVRQAASRPHAI